jgi:hypothetical protein
VYLLLAMKRIAVAILLLLPVASAFLGCPWLQMQHVRPSRAVQMTRANEVTEAQLQRGTFSISFLCMQSMREQKAIAIFSNKHHAPT